MLICTLPDDVDCPVLWQCVPWCEYLQETGGADHETDTVDAVPVVRCRDCKYSYEDISGRCCSHGPCKDWVVLDDSFCSQGERRKDNENR